MCERVTLLMRQYYHNYLFFLPDILWPPQDSIKHSSSMSPHHHPCTFGTQMQHANETIKHSSSLCVSLSLNPFFCVVSRYCHTSKWRWKRVQVRRSVPLNKIRRCLVSSLYLRVAFPLIPTSWTLRPVRIDPVWVAVLRRDTLSY